MKLSIITPIYNERQRIEEFLKRLEKQTVKPEIVLVDGGSTDGTIEFVKKYQKKHKNVKLYFETGECRSPANARNIGLRKATGNVVIWADVDSFFEEKFCEKIVKEFERNKGAEMIRFKANPKPYLVKKFKSRIQRAYYWRDSSRHIRDKEIGRFILKKSIHPEQDSELGYGEDKLFSKKLSEIINKYGFYESRVKLSGAVLGPKNLSEVWKRYKWYGRTGMLYYYRSKDKIHLLKMVLAVLSIPFFPLMIIPMARGFVYAAGVFKKYPQGIILIPLLEAVAFPAMAVGFWEYVTGKAKKHRGH